MTIENNIEKKEPKPILYVCPACLDENDYKDVKILYGDNDPITTECPACKKEINLRTKDKGPLMDRLKTIPTFKA
jgi:hypothetical protein